MGPRFVVVLLLALLTPVRGEDEPSSPQDAAPREEARPQSKTTVAGTVPSGLAGRWVAMGWMQLPNGKTRNVPYFWEITEESGEPRLRVRFVWFPDAQNEAMRNANKAGEPWRPSPEDLAAANAAWDRLPLWRGPGPSEVSTEILGRDALDDELKNDARMKDAEWVVRNHFLFPPSKAGASTAQQVNVYGVLSAEGDGYAGNYKTFVLAAAPFLTPLNFEGTFRLYRLEPPRRGIAARVLDLFRGCGRR
jgi:hypothetical protein